MEKDDKNKNDKPTASLLTDLLGDLQELFLSLPPLPEMPTYGRSNYYTRSLSDSDWQKILDSKKKKRVLRRLNEKKLVETKQTQEGVLLKFSTDALVKAIKAEIQNKKDRMPGGQVCLVFFDFPVGANKARSFWRRFLLSSGFERVQLSIYKTQKDVVLELVTLVELAGIKSWVEIYRGSRQN